MGMFDDIKCMYPLPLAGANALAYQTKDTPAQYLDLYEIREDGTLWHEDYDTEDHSEAAKWERDHPGQEAPEGLNPLCGCMTRVNKRWNQLENFTGEIVFYTNVEQDAAGQDSGWLEWSAYFVAGKLNQIRLLK